MSDTEHVDRGRLDIHLAGGDEEQPNGLKLTLYFADDLDGTRFEYGGFDPTGLTQEDLDAHLDLFAAQAKERLRMLFAQRAAWQARFDENGRLRPPAPEANP